MQTLYLEGKREEAYEAIPDEIVDATSLVGTEDEVAERLERFVAAGVDRIIVSPIQPDTGERVHTIERMSALVAAGAPPRRGRVGQRPALITGAAHGIGEGTAEALARARLVAWRWSTSTSAAAEAVASGCGDRAAAFAADITDQEAVDGAVAGAVERVGGLDLCFANAGIATGGAMRHTDPDVFAVKSRSTSVGTFRTVRACLPHLIESRGYVL